MEIRRATAEDAEAISRLIKGLARYFTLDPQGAGAEEFLASIEPAAVRGYVTADDFSYFVGHLDGQLAGVVALRDSSHLYHLFVAEEFQGRGLSRELWRHASAAALAAGNSGSFTVNSTINAAPIYRRFGFREAGTLVKRNGIAYLPMRLDPKAPNAG